MICGKNTPRLFSILILTLVLAHGSSSMAAQLSYSNGQATSGVGNNGSAAAACTNCPLISGSKSHRFKEVVRAAQPDAIAALAGAERTDLLDQAVGAVLLAARDEGTDIAVEDAIRWIALQE